MTLNAAALEAARIDLHLSMRELWIRCVGLGGLLTETELSDALLSQDEFSTLEYDIVAQALNEEHLDAGGDHPVAYSDET